MIESDSSENEASAKAPISATDSKLSGSDLLSHQLTLTPDSPESSPEEVTDTVPGTSPEIADPYIGAMIDRRYLVEKRIGEGGMGVVYLCRHISIDKKVAMKVLRPDLARSKEAVERFVNEARSASAIGNAHIIDISDFGRLPDGAAYFVMEYLEGTPLVELAESGVPMAPARVAHIALQLTVGLAAAHDAGIIHRDLKPDNIFLVKQGSEDEFVKILDFGIAKVTASTSKLTQAGQVFGTPHYMSPEQADGARIDGRADIYALGVILYELTTGKLPFDAENSVAVLSQHMYRQPTPPSELPGLNLQLPPAFEASILKCLAKSPNDRFQTMQELGDLLEQNFIKIPKRGEQDKDLAEKYQDFKEKFPEGKQKRTLPKDVRKRKLLISLVLGLASLSFATVGALYWNARTREAEKPPSAAQAALATATKLSKPSLKEVPVPAPSPPAQEEGTPPFASKVSVKVSPPGAHVFHGAINLGAAPLRVPFNGKAVKLQVRLQGYEAQTIVIDGKDSLVSVSLKTRKRKPRKSSNKKSELGGQEMPSPWDE